MPPSSCTGQRLTWYQILVLKSERESKKYDFEALSRPEAAEIVEEIMKGMDLYKDVTV